MLKIIKRYYWQVNKGLHYFSYLGIFYLLYKAEGTASECRLSDHH